MISTVRPSVIKSASRMLPTKPTLPLAIPALQAIADPPHRDEVLGFRRIGLEFLPPVANVDRDRSRIAGEIRSPHVIQQAFAGKDLTGIAGDEPQQVELAGGQLVLL